MEGTYDNVQEQTVSEHEEGEFEQEREYDMQSIYYDDRCELNNDHSQMMYDQTASMVPDEFSQQYDEMTQQIVQYGDEEGSQQADQLEEMD